MPASTDLPQAASEKNLPAPEPKAILTAPSMGLEHRAEMRAVFDRAIKLAEKDRLKLHVPHENKPGKILRGMHYHYRPEFFLQLQGETEFQFPRNKAQVRPDEVCIIPAGVPHGEQVSAEPGRAFRNLVGGFYNNTLSLHFAREVKPGRPDIEAIEFFDAPNLDVFITLCSSLVQTHSMQSPARNAVLKGLLLALLGMYRNVVETGTGRLNSDIGKVFQAKCLVREQFSNPELSVNDIAKTLGCSADYLSHLFHTETKERLIHYIQRIRIDGAVLALEGTALTVSEIAYSSGFSDPAYFARVFKQHKGITPVEYRALIEARRKLREEKPKTVYHDRIDFSPGVPAPSDQT